MTRMQTYLGLLHPRPKFSRELRPRSNRRGSSRAPQHVRCPVGTAPPISQALFQSSSGCRLGTRPAHYRFTPRRLRGRASIAAQLLQLGLGFLETLPSRHHLC
jgi:hypothetical protein